MEQTVARESFIEAITFKRLKRVMTEGTGINFDYYRESYIKRRLKLRLTATKTNTYTNYSQYLQANPDEFTDLIKDLTINYTKFFRDPDVYSNFSLLRDGFESGVLDAPLAKNRILWQCWCMRCGNSKGLIVGSTSMLQTLTKLL